MNKEDIIEKLKKIVHPYIKNQKAFDQLDEKTDFVNDLKINSANLVDIILDTEEEFGIIIDNDSMEKMLNIESTISIIQTKMDEK